MIRKTIGDISFDLLHDFDFSFLAPLGNPFAVFDQQDSGNLCFGMRDGDRKTFIKLAGASTVRGGVTPSEAVARMRSTVKVYQDLAHPGLISLMDHAVVDRGYYLAFPWFDGVCMGPMYGNTREFLELPVERKLRLYDAILEFHQHVNEQGYAAIDFYDGGVMYDFNAHRTLICDIEFYRLMPVINDMGRMWGSSRFMSPEEFTLGATIDERSNVFCMGTTAFQLFGGGVERDRQKWEGSGKMFRAALKAAHPHRDERYPSISAYRMAWNEACRT